MIIEQSLNISRVIDAAHHLLNYDGKCSRVHGHSFYIEAKIKGKPVQDMIVDFTKVKDVIDKLDHQNLNEILNFNPTAENLSLYLAEQILNLTDKITEVEVKVWETKDNCAISKVIKDSQKTLNCFM